MPSIVRYLLDGKLTGHSHFRANTGHAVSGLHCGRPHLGFRANVQLIDMPDTWLTWNAVRRAYQQGGSRGAATLDRIAADHALGGKESAGEPGHVRDSLRHRGPGVNPMPAEGIFQDDAEM